jgi:hypothetical protein
MCYPVGNPWQMCLLNKYIHTWSAYILSLTANTYLLGILTNKVHNDLLSILLLQTRGLVYICSGIVSDCHRGDWSYGSWDRIPPGYRVVKKWYYAGSPNDVSLNNFSPKSTKQLFPKRRFPKQSFPKQHFPKPCFPKLRFPERHFPEWPLGPLG